MIVVRECENFKFFLSVVLWPEKTNDVSTVTSANGSVWCWNVRRKKRKKEIRLEKDCLKSEGSYWDVCMCVCV